MAEQGKPKVGSIAIFIKTATEYLLFKCNTDLTFTRSRDTIDASSKCGPDQIASANATYEISGSGQVWLFGGATPGSTTELSEAEADRLLVNNTKFSWKIAKLKEEEVVPGDVEYDGQGFFTNLATTWPNDQVSTFDFTIAVSGEYNQVITPAG